MRHFFLLRIVSDLLNNCRTLCEYAAKIYGRFYFPLKVFPHLIQRFLKLCLYGDNESLDLAKKIIYIYIYIYIYSYSYRYHVFKIADNCFSTLRGKLLFFLRLVVPSFQTCAWFQYIIAGINVVYFLLFVFCIPRSRVWLSRFERCVLVN